MKGKFLEYLIIGVLVIGIGLFFISFDKIMDFIARLLMGWKGALVMLGVAMAITYLLAFFIDLSSRELIYVALIAIVVCAAVWFYFNINMVFAWLEATIGIWGAIGVGVALIVVGWFVLHFLL